MNKQVSVTVRWYGDIPERNGKQLPKNRWARAGRKRKWLVRWRAPDGTRPGTTFDTERDAMAFQRSKVAEFESQGPLSRIQPKRVTLGEFAAEFEQLQQGPKGKRLAIRTLDIYLDTLKRFRAHVGDSTPLEAITRANVVRFFAHLQNGDDLSGHTVNKIKRTLKSAFNVAKNLLQYVKSNPCDGIEQDQMEETDNRFVTPEEFARLREACGGTFHPLWWRTFLTVCYTAGVRKGEALHLLWSDIDFDDGTIRIVAKKDIEGALDWKPKGRGTRTIPVPDETIELLRALRVEAGFSSKMVFVSSLRLAWIRQKQDAGERSERQETLNGINRSFRAIARRAGVDDVSPHDLRRSCLTLWARKLPAHVLKELAGHSSIVTTQKYYLSVQPDELMRAKDAVALALLSDTKRTQTA